MAYNTSRAGDATPVVCVTSVSAFVLACRVKMSASGVVGTRCPIWIKGSLFWEPRTPLRALSGHLFMYRMPLQLQMQ